MATIVVKVCEECGKQSSSVDGWLVVSALDVKSAGSGRVLVRSDKELDLCSPGCLLRYISRNIDRASASAACPLLNDRRVA